MMTPDEASVGYRDTFEMHTVLSQVVCPKALPTLGGDRPNPVAQHVRGGQRESQPRLRCGAKWMHGSRSNNMIYPLTNEGVHGNPHFGISWRCISHVLEMVRVHTRLYT